MICHTLNTCHSEISKVYFQRVNYTGKKLLPDVWRVNEPELNDWLFVDADRGQLGSFTFGRRELISNQNDY